MAFRHPSTSHSRNSIRFVVGVRWVLLLLTPFLLELSTEGSSGPMMWVVLLLFAISNIFLHLRAHRIAGAGQRWLWHPAFVSDLLLITTVVVLRGGIRSDSYLLYLLVACEAGILLRTRQAWAVGVMASIAYAGAVVAVNGAGALDRVAIRFIYLGLAAVATTYLAASERKASAEALTDSKTNLPNARLFQEALADAVAHCSRVGEPLSLAIMDVDNFRQLNSEIGHPLADKVLEQMADVLVAWQRPGELIARYGGEEFVFLLPGQDLTTASARLDSLRSAIADRLFIPGVHTTVHVTISVGVSSLEMARSSSALVITADRALLEAKATGKNRVVTARADQNGTTPGA